MKTAFLSASILVIGLATVTFGQAPNIETVLAQRLALEKKTVLEKGKRISKTGIALGEICDLSDPVAARVFRDYGAMWIGRSNVFAEFKQGINGDSIRFLANCVFDSEAEVSLYHSNVASKSLNAGGVQIQLQEAAMEALVEARKEAATLGLAITPRGGSIAATRTYDDTVRLWRSRFLPGLANWTAKGKISRRDAEAAKSLPIREQVARVLEWESRGYYFSTDFSKSILYSVAAPGASQHIFMVALDVEQFGNSKVRAVLARHGWFQTVKSDLPHFTYLGVEEKALPSLGLESVTVSGQKFWIPKL